MSRAKVVSVRFENYWKSYAFETKLDLVPGKKYKIIASGAKYATPVVIDDYLEKGPKGIELKEIEEAYEVS